MAEQTPPAPIAFTGLRIFSRIVLALMVVGMLYVAWLSLSYWPEIRV